MLLCCQNKSSAKAYDGSRQSDLIPSLGFKPDSEREAGGNLRRVVQWMDSNSINIDLLSDGYKVLILGYWTHNKLRRRGINSITN